MPEMFRERDADPAPGQAGYAQGEGQGALCDLWLDEGFPDVSGSQPRK